MTRPGLRHHGYGCRRLARGVSRRSSYSTSRRCRRSRAQAAVLFGGWDDDKVLPLLERGVRWVQLPGTGIDGVPSAVFDADSDGHVRPRGECGADLGVRPGDDARVRQGVSRLLAGRAARTAGTSSGWTRSRRHRPSPSSGLGGIGTAIARRALAFDMTSAPSGERRPRARSRGGGGDEPRRPGADAHHVVLAAPGHRGPGICSTPRHSRRCPTASMWSTSPGARSSTRTRCGPRSTAAGRACEPRYGRSGAVARRPLAVRPPEGVPDAPFVVGIPGPPRCVDRRSSAPTSAGISTVSRCCTWWTSAEGY